MGFRVPVTGIECLSSQFERLVLELPLALRIRHIAAYSEQEPEERRGHG